MVTTRSRTNPTASSTAETKKTTSSSAPPSKKAAASKTAPKKKAEEEEEGGGDPKSKKTLEVGDALPEETPKLVVHTDEDTEGKGTTLGELVKESERGVVMFFYPAASTPGCTNQANFFQENLEKFTKKGYTVCGCSKDKPAAQTKWHTKHSLGYNLYTDSNADTAELVGLLKAGRKMQRGIVIVEKVDGGGKVVAGGAYGPEPSLNAALKYVEAA
ncbi:hypothetical protein CF319_g8126 [Tilletia indica]|nr:hypothetical protein CF319_g8126 [Tilletia indica]